MDDTDKLFLVIFGIMVIVFVVGAVAQVNIERAKLFSNDDSLKDLVLEDVDCEYRLKLLRLELENEFLRSNFLRSELMVYE